MGFENNDEAVTNDVTNCILVSFRNALRLAQEEMSVPDAPEFVIVAEDDMTLQTDFIPKLEAVARELRDDPLALGAALHSTTLAIYFPEAQSAHGGLALFKK